MKVRTDDAPVMDLGTMLEIVNSAQLAVGETKQFKLDDEFFDMISIELQNWEYLMGLIPIPMKLAKA